MKTIILFRSVGLFLPGLGNATEEKLKVQAETYMHPELQQNNEMHTLKLNSGKKWKVDANTLQHIHNMENDVSVFCRNEQKDYMTIAKQFLNIKGSFTLFNPYFQ
ncbi:MAG: hypothetical protein Q8M15_04175 [Bacteroidota bacterium]|nr:hypothetical protein [Bacteroidota bacterium]